jgi:hypothetical protein
MQRVHVHGMAAFPWPAKGFKRRRVDVACWRRMACSFATGGSPFLRRELSQPDVERLYRTSVIVSLEGRGPEGLGGSSCLLQILCRFDCDSLKCLGVFRF